MLKAASVFWILFVSFFLGFGVLFLLRRLRVCLILLSLLPLFLFVLLGLLYLLGDVKMLISFAHRFVDELLAVLLPLLLFGRIILALGRFALASAHFFLQHFPLIFASALVFSLLVVDQFLHFAILHSPDLILLLLLTSGYLGGSCSTLGQGGVQLQTRHHDRLLLHAGLLGLILVLISTFRLHICC